MGWKIPLKSKKQYTYRNEPSKRVCDGFSHGVVGRDSCACLPVAWARDDDSRTRMLSKDGRPMWVSHDAIEPHVLTAS